MSHPVATTGREPVYDSRRRPHPFIGELLALVRHRDLVVLWTERNIKLRYKRSVLGIVWTLLEPLLLMAILSFVFSTAFKFPVPNYPIYVLTGLLLYDFLNRSTTQMIDQLIDVDSLAKRIHVPRTAFAAASVLSYLVNWLLALLPLGGLMLFFGQPLTLSLLTLPLGIALTALFVLGVGLTVSAVAILFHDAKLIFNVILVAWFYATPIIYPIEILPADWAPVLRANPLYALVRLVRDPVMEGRAAPLELWAIGAAVSFAAAVAGWWVFSRSRDLFNYRA